MSGRLKKTGAAFLTGAFMVTSAWAGSSLVPVPEGNQPAAAVTKNAPKPAPTPASPAPSAGAPAPAAVSAPIDPASLPEGQVLAGAAKISIEPRPKDFGGTWETDAGKCRRMDPAAVESAAKDPVEFGDHLAAAGSPWQENPNCIYMGGFGLGPANPVIKWDQQLGLWVRAVALRDRQGDDLVMVILDGEGYFWDYGKKCSDCGIKQLTEQLAADKALGLEAKNITIASTHAHSSPDFIGGWGFVPDWYMKQVSETIKQTVRDAVASLRPAVLEYGEHEAREFNGERRDTYRSAEEQNLAWLRAYAPGANSGQGNDETIATLGAYAAHPTTEGTNGGEAHPDWPGFFEKRLEERFGGIGLHFMTGLGNLSAKNLPGGTTNLAGLIPALGGGRAIADPDIRTARTTWQQPVTNVPLTALGLPGFFDRKFAQTPAQLRTGEDPDMGHCASASPVSAEVPVSAARIGELAFTAAPGEIFANYSNTIKETSGAEVSFPLGQANDALGYMPQSFELNPVGQQGLGFAVGGAVFVNYEDSYAIDKCFGDHALETSIDLLGQLKK